MNDDYLWDRTGEPDPEIQQLEQALGTLRHQPQRLEIPASLMVARKRSRVSTFAIAASIAIMILAAGLWTVLHRRSTTGLASAPDNPVNARTTATVAASPELNRSSDQITKALPKTVKSNQQVTARPSRRLSGSGNNATLARSGSRDRHALRENALTADEQREAEVAKQQLFLALRVASSKLSLAQKRTQGAYPTNQIRNQHKIG
ncbi:MAG: hypothetical protein ABI967_05045 [bacterium]